MSGAHVSGGRIAIDDELGVDAVLYSFFAPQSYTSEDVAEIHAYANEAVAKALLQKLLSMGLRSAEPGEFTARAFLNGKIDLSQAEAVNEIIIGSNATQLTAAQRLLDGRLSRTTDHVRLVLIDLLTSLEAALDFSDENIEFISHRQTIDAATAVNQELEQLLAGSITCESILDLPSVGIAGAPNAGKSTLLNALLGYERSIVCEQPKTTRDVLSGTVCLAHCDCVLFDCAGLVLQPADLLDELTQQAAVGALEHSDLTLFCVDVSKADWSEDAHLRLGFGGLDTSVRLLITADHPCVAVTTKCDLLDQTGLLKCLARLKDRFGVEFLPVSAKTGLGMELLRRTIDQRLTARVPSGMTLPQDGPTVIGLTARHRQAVTDAIDCVTQSIDELTRNNPEIGAMLLRAAHESLSRIDRPGAGHIDEQILNEIFSRFCIGK
jgi:tRNA modification GTPase